MTHYEAVRAGLRAQPKTWLITGAAGFIGSHLVETLLDLEQRVIGLDDFASDRRGGISDTTDRLRLHPERFRLIHGDIRDPSTCLRACTGVDYVLHQAALISVPESIAHPERYHEVNVTGFLNLCMAAARRGVQRLVYASSCAVYGDTQPAEKAEEMRPAPVSPYAVTKLMDEQYGALFHRTMGLETVGLRYFNVYGPRQGSGGAYGAVIPRWVRAMLQGEPCTIYGDGLATRDFCSVSDVVQANLLAARFEITERSPTLYNVGSGEQVTLRQLHSTLRELLPGGEASAGEVPPIYAAARPGDIRDICADVGLAREHLGYVPLRSLRDGLAETVRWWADLEGGPPPRPVDGQPRRRWKPIAR